MGLDIAELVMDIEDTFDFEWPDEKFFSNNRSATLGDIHNYVMTKLAQRNFSRRSDGSSAEVWIEEDVWLKIRETVARVLCVPIERVTKTARLIEDLNAG